MHIDILFIVGPTASGKTDAALSLVPDLLLLPGVTGVDILSADSKQVYTEQDIVTGKDRSAYEKAVKLYGDRVGVFGIDVVSPNQEWSISHFVSYATRVAQESRSRKRVLVVVGGSGQYISSLIHPPATMTVVPNTELRAELEQYSVEKLQEKLQEIDAKKYERMNESDVRNPRRLIRAIEVGMSDTENKVVSMSSSFASASQTWIGLRAAKDDLEKRIAARVRLRLEQGAVAEYTHLRQAYPDWSKEARSAIGYAEIEQYLQGETTFERMIELWTQHELQYTKRQMTWFAKQPTIQWFEVQEAHLHARLVKLLKY